MRTTLSSLSERAKNWATFAVSMLLALVLAEGASRILVARVTPAGMRFDDGILYTYAPRTELSGMVLNDVGCVGDDALPKASGETRVLLLGGSTSFSARYVAAVKENLQRAHPGRSFRVMSRGKPRYTSFVNRANFERRASVWAPDGIRSRAIFEENLIGILGTARSRNAKPVLATFVIALPTEDGKLLARIRADEKVMRHFWGNIGSEC